MMEKQFFSLKVKFQADKWITELHLSINFKNVVILKFDL